MGSHQPPDGFKKMSLDLPIDLHTDLKVLAAKRGVTLAAILHAGAEHYRRCNGEVDWLVPETHVGRRNKEFSRAGVARTKLTLRSVPPAS